MKSEELNNRYQETIQTWNDIAQLYDDHFSSLDIYNASYNQLLSLLKEHQTKVLEIGAGPGMISQYLHKINPILDFTITDVAPKMVEIIQLKFPTANTFLLDARQLSQLNESYNIIIAGFCIPYLCKDDLATLFKSIQERLSKNGLFYFSFVPGQYSSSSFQVGSNGKRTYFYFHEELQINAELKLNGFEVIHQESVQYQRKNGPSQEHLILIAQKRND